MYTLGIVGPAGATTALTGRIAEHLAERGRVATVERLDEPPADATGLDADERETSMGTTYGIADDGSWVASGADRGLEAILDDLAPEHDYAVVEGFDDAMIPQVVLGERGGRGPVLAEATDAGDVDVERVCDALESTEPHVTLETLVSRVKRSPRADRAGAIATFTGRVREKDGADDAPTEALEFETYEGVADRRLTALREELESRDGVYEVRMHHRTGLIPTGEDIVFVVVLAGHRGEAFRTVEDGINRLKSEVPIFKKEVTTDEEFWVHTRD
ncbi:molybdopterin synthase [Halalkalicoccus ordinarius]|uniref:molybdopterin synthase n=1 Tax=Halalkalicoccus ordinarius TaxID=3116651 RepID=UPI00300F5C23